MTSSRKRPSHQVLSQTNMAAIVELVHNHGNLTLACQAVGLTPQTFHKWLDRCAENPKDPRYIIVDPLGEDPPVTLTAAYDAARRRGQLLQVEDALVQQATGYDEPVVFQGEIMMLRDYDATPRIVDGRAVYPLKLDALGQPQPLTVRKVNAGAGQFVLKSRHPDYKEKTELDITSGGKPFAVPQRSGSVAEFLAEFGRKPETE